MKLFTYIVVHDTGFSPNPFWGYCTLACCKPTIRRTAKQGVWIAGISAKKDGNRLVYAMEITEPPLTFSEYYRDPRFRNKIPRFERGKDRKYRLGDNIYKPLPSGEFLQLRSRHSLPNGEEDLKKKAADLGGKYVLVSTRFWYFGMTAKALPDRLEQVTPGRGHRCRFDNRTVSEFMKYIIRHKPGVRGYPKDWPSGGKPEQVILTGKCKL